MSGTISRRGFVRDVIRGLIAGIAVALPLAKTVASAESPDIAQTSDNWWSFREEIKRLVRQGYDVTSHSLAAEKDGYRRVRVNVAHDQPITWQQPWNKARHLQENTNYNFASCDCGAKTMTRHVGTCSHATHLAWRLGADLEGFRA